MSKEIRVLPSQEVLQQLYLYDSITGYLYFRERTPKEFFDGYRSSKGNCNNWNSRYTGKRAFTSTKVGGCTRYYEGNIKNIKYLAHRVIWKLVYGEDPTCIDHIDGNGLNNIIYNLRNVSLSENSRNSRKHLSDRPITGVSYRPKENKYVAYVTAQPRKPLLWLGSFSTVDEAIAARKYAEPYFNYHPNHGRIS